MLHIFMLQKFSARNNGWLLHGQQISSDQGVIEVLYDNMIGHGSEAVRWLHGAVTHACMTPNSKPAKPGQGVLAIKQ